MREIDAPGCGGAWLRRIVQEHHARRPTWTRGNRAAHDASLRYTAARVHKPSGPQPGARWYVDSGAALRVPRPGRRAARRTHAACAATVSNVRRAVNTERRRINARSCPPPSIAFEGLYSFSTRYRWRTRRRSFAFVAPSRCIDRARAASASAKEAPRPWPSPLPSPGMDGAGACLVGTANGSECGLLEGHFRRRRGDRSTGAIVERRAEAVFAFGILARAFFPLPWQQVEI